MAKTHSTHERVARNLDMLLSRERIAFSGIKMAEGEEYPLDRIETVTLVCKLLCQGLVPGEISDTLKKEYGIVMSRELPYKLVSLAAQEGWLRFKAPLNGDLIKRLEEAFPSLHGSEVVHTATSEHLADQGANMIVRLLRRYRQGAKSRKLVHVGFAGGPTMRKVARLLAEELCKPKNGLPEAICFHALVSGFDPYDTTTDPNAFFTYFVSKPGMPTETSFVGLHAPALVKSRDFPRLKQLTGIKEAYDVRKKLDIIVTSGAEWEDEHSLFRRCMKRSRSAPGKLKEEGCVGDILWRPIGPKKPIEVPTDIRAMTLLDLSDLTRYIRDDRQVVLILGACGGCNRPKGKILRSLINQQKQLITHLVTDSRTVCQALDEMEVD